MNESRPEVEIASAAPEAEHVSVSTIADSSAAPPDAADDETRTPRRRAKHYRRRQHHGLVGLAIVLLIAAALAITLRLFVVQTFFVPTGSMLPTLQIYDRILVLKVGYTIHRGDIVVFRQPPKDTTDLDHEDLVKRVIGLPGETISSNGNTVYINGKPLAEPWLPKGTVLGQPIATQTIPQGDYFMMGDNRSESDDSRDWGPLPARLIIGKVLVVIWRHGRPAFHIQ
jgi:signal peptidase I